MTLRIVAVDDPPAGADWFAIVPGEYIYHVTGITGTLMTGAPGVAVDSSGNGRDGTYDGFQAFVPGLVAGDQACDFGRGVAPFGLSHVVIPPAMPDLTQGFTFEFWAESAAAGSSWQGAIRYLTAPPFTNGFLEIYGISVGGNDGVIHIGAYTITWETDPIVDLFDGNPHLITIACDGVNSFTIKVDAVTVTSAEIGGPNTVTNFTALTASIGSTAGTLLACRGILDEVAIFDQELGFLQVAAHYAAASVSFAAYTAAVLADAPVAYYHLDDAATGPRQVTLAVEYGITEVMQIPTGFALASSLGPYFYSWGPSLSSSTQNPDGTITAVDIPDLILPAGYIVRAETIDIQPTDQWSGVLVWWDDDIMRALDPAGPYRYPPGAHLVYERRPGV